MSKFLFYSGILTVFLSDQVFAEAAAAPSGGSRFDNPIVGMLLILAVLFFLIILPQSRRAKKQNEFLATLQKGDAVVTASGIYGKIYGIAEKVITLEVAPGMRIRIDRQTIASKDTTPGAQSTGFSDAPTKVREV